VTLGFLLGAGSLFWFSDLNLQVNYWNLFWPSSCRASLQPADVPLTVVTMDRIAPEAIGNAASLFNLMRNLGGSVGIAVTQTLLDRFRQGQINTLGSHVSANSPAARTTLEGLRRMFVAHGSDPMTATQQAHIMVWDMVQKQAATIAYSTSTAC